ncbi:MAG TPA: hypothetical protein VN914_07585, partial [Polyangia bacterium]|nr:hypothetical protein [Polyangia bacterium]
MPADAADAGDAAPISPDASATPPDAAGDLARDGGLTADLEIPAQPLPQPLVGDQLPTRTCGIIGLGSIEAVAYLPDGSGYLAGSDAGFVKLFRASDDAEVRVFDGHQKGIQAMALSADGALLATAADDELKVWRITDGALLRTLAGHTRAIRSVAISSDGTVASGDVEGELRVWSAGGAPLAVLPPPPREAGLFSRPPQIVTLVFLSDGSLLSARLDGKIDLSTASGAPIRRVVDDAGTLFSLALAPDGQTFATGGPQAARWRLSDGERLETYPTFPNINALRFTPDGKRLFVVSDGSVIWGLDVPGGQSLPLTQIASLSPRRDLAVSPDGKTVLTIGGEQAMSLELYDSALPSPSPGPAPRQVIGQGYPGMHKVAFSRDGQRLAVACDSLLEVRRVADRALLRTLAVPGKSYAGAADVAFSPDGRYLASADTTARLWEVATGNHLVEMGKPSVRMESVTFLPDGKSLLATGYERLAALYAIPDGALLADLPGTGEVTYGGAVAPDGSAIAIGDNRAGVTGVRASDRTVSFHLDPPITAWSLAYSPDSRLLAISNWEDVLLVNAGDGTPRASMHATGPGISQVAFSPSGQVLAAVGPNRSVHFWRVADAMPLPLLPAHPTTRMRSVAFSPDGRYL